MKEYVIRISSRDPHHPLTETAILSFGSEATGPQFTEALTNMVELLKMYGTPEKVAAFMVDNAALANAKHLTIGSN